MDERLENRLRVQLLTCEALIKGLQNWLVENDHYDPLPDGLKLTIEHILKVIDEGKV